MCTIKIKNKKLTTIQCTSTESMSTSTDHPRSPAEAQKRKKMMMMRIYIYREMREEKNTRAGEARARCIRASRASIGDWRAGSRRCASPGRE